MKIAHLCLSCYYVDGYNYQENVLPRVNNEDGHDVYVIASTETFVDNVNIGYVAPSSYMTEYGVPIKRLQYHRILTHYISSKLRFYKGLYDELNDFHPDIVYIHDACFGSIRAVVYYKKRNPKTKIFVDTHTAYHNSGLNWVSMNLLHKLFYRKCIKLILPYIEKYYYIGDNEKRFSMEIYNVPKSKMEFLPLGGLIPKDDEYFEIRNTIRKELNVSDDEFLFVHSGKLNKTKKTDMLLGAFYNVKDLKAKLIIIGSMDSEIEKDIKEKIGRDSRVSYLGWKDSNCLMNYLCAADLYCQPGSVSATMQNAICNFCPVIAYPFQDYLDIDCGNFIWVKTFDELQDAFIKIRDSKINLDLLTDNARKCARNILDYRKLARRYC